MPPEDAGPVRVVEQEMSAKVVGVEDVTFLGYRDGVVGYDRCCVGISPERSVDTDRTSC